MTDVEKHAPHIVGTKFYSQAEVDAKVNAERAAIVAWLLKEASEMLKDEAEREAEALEEAADAIQRGDHLENTNER